MSHEQYEEWFQFWQLSPWGGAREDYRAGLLAMVAQGSNPWGKGKLMQPEEWFPNLKEDEQPELGFTAVVSAAPGLAPAVPTKTPQQAADELRAWVMASGGKVTA